LEGKRKEIIDARVKRIEQRLVDYQHIHESNHTISLRNPV
jgi:hypothetical protein